jgi:hypothetical protein
MRGNGVARPHGGAPRRPIAAKEGPMRFFATTLMVLVSTAASVAFMASCMDRPLAAIDIVPVGIGPHAASTNNCTETGKMGLLHSSPPVGELCPVPTDPFIIDVQGEEGERLRNYQGTLTETFSCIARLGAGRAQQLPAPARLALYL